MTRSTTYAALLAAALLIATAGEAAAQMGPGGMFRHVEKISHPVGDYGGYGPRGYLDNGPMIGGYPHISPSAPTRPHYGIGGPGYPMPYAAPIRYPQIGCDYGLGYGGGYTL